MPRTGYVAHGYWFDELSSAMHVRYLTTAGDIWNCDGLSVLRSAGVSVLYLVYQIEKFIRRLT